MFGILMGHKFTYFGRKTGFELVQSRVLFANASMSTPLPPPPPGINDIYPILPNVTIVPVVQQLGPVSQRVAINRTMDIHRSSMANCVQLAINRSLRLIATLSETGPRKGVPFDYTRDVTTLRMLDTGINADLSEFDFKMS